MKALLCEKHSLKAGYHSDISVHLSKVSNTCRNNYRTLKEESENSRYNGFKDEASFLADREQNYLLVRDCLKQVVKYVEQNQKVSLGVLKKIG